MSDTRTQILDLAEKAMRIMGYHAVSFRDLADDLGIKSASIHYHFRQKEDLGFHVVDRYAKRISEHLGPPGTDPWPVALGNFCQVYVDALRKGERQCLCSMLAAESRGLPDKVSARVADFFRGNIDWLIESMPTAAPEKRLAALRIQSAIQGAMTVAVSTGEHGILDEIAESLKASAVH